MRNRYELNDTREQLREKHMALNKALPVPNYEPDMRYQDKNFSRVSKRGIHARPNHLGDGIVVDLPEGF